MGFKHLPQWLYARLKINQLQVVTRTTEFVGNGDEHEERKEPYHRSVLARQRRLTGVEEERKSPPFSGPSQGDAAAGLMKIRGATAAAVAELR